MTALVAVAAGAASSLRTVGTDLSELSDLIRDVPGFPRPGVVFKDITPLLGNGPAWHRTVVDLAALHGEQHVDHVVGIEARGFVLGAAVAYHLGAGFVPIRKLGKLPHVTASVAYDLEYGTDALEMHTDAFAPGERVLMVDDVLATGGTGRAALQLVRGAGARIVGSSFLMELTFLGGRRRLGDEPVHALLTY